MKAVAFSFRAYLQDGTEFFKQSYVGDKAVQKFLSLLKQVEPIFQDFIRTNIPMNLSKYEIYQHLKRENCETCGVTFGLTSNSIKARHHDHMTGKFISSVCTKCNLEMRRQYYVPIYVHNLTYFDSNLIIAASEMPPKNSISYNSEAVMTFTLGQFKFIDSLLFLKQPLSQLVSNLYDKDPKLFKILRKSELCQTDSKFDPKKFELMASKLIFPYKALEGGISCLVNENFLHKKYFYNDLTYSYISDEEHGKAIEIAQVYNCKTFKQYINLYVKLDTILLADVWNYFVKSMILNYKGLNPESGYISLPQFIFDSVKSLVFRERGTEIKLISNELPQFYDDCCSGIRGGKVFLKSRLSFSSDFEQQMISFMNIKERKIYNNLLKQKLVRSDLKSIKSEKNPSSIKCSKCPRLINPILKTKYCDFHEPRHIIALDFTNLYGLAMSYKLPFSDFSYLNKSQLRHMQELFDSISSGKKADSILDDKAQTGYIFCVDIYFPKKVHQKLDRFVVCPIKSKVTFDMLSYIQKQIFKKLNIDKQYKSTEDMLIPSFKNIKNYVIHYSLLKSYCQLGIRVIINRGYKFYQDTILKTHVTNCSKRRSLSSSKIDQVSEKYQSNLLFGKTCEKIENRVHIIYYGGFSNIEKNCKSKTIKNFKIIRDNLVQVSYDQPFIKFTRPIHLGFCVLEISKKIVLDFYYNVLNKKFHPTKIKCLYSDTDSYYLEIKGIDLSEIYKRLNNYLDFSNFPPSHSKYNTDNKFKLGFLKIDTSDKLIHSFLAIRKKSYCLYTSLPGQKPVRTTKLKGVKKSAFSKILLSDYKKTILGSAIKRVNVSKIAKSRHNLYLTNERKIALNSFDSSSLYKTCGICTTTFFINKKNTVCNDINCKIFKLLLTVWERCERQNKF